MLGFAISLSIMGVIVALVSISSELYRIANALERRKDK